MGSSYDDPGARDWRVAVVGAGPAGLYGSDALLKQGAAVDLFERQYAPYGLLRFGVAPDHQKIKRSEKVFARILEHPRLRYFGGIDVGRQLEVEDLLELYDQVLITSGSARGRRLQVPGSHLDGIWTATDFVGWYNSHPDHQRRTPDLGHGAAVVVGMGNVAIDVARVLLRDPEELSSTDINPSALDALRSSRIREVTLLARRGPNQAAFDLKELRELAACSNIDIEVDGYVARRPTPLSDAIRAFPRRSSVLGTGRRKVVLSFCASPRAIEGEAHVESLVVERNELVESASSIKARGTGTTWRQPCGLLVFAVGYRGESLPGVPFEESTGTVPNDEGRVLTAHHGDPLPGLYVAGWIKRGPTGLLGQNKSCAAQTVAHMKSDLSPVGPLRDPAELPHLLSKRGVRWIGLDDWKRLDTWERERGSAAGQPRQKITTWAAARAILGHSPSDRADPDEGRAEN